MRIHGTKIGKKPEALIEKEIVTALQAQGLMVVKVPNEALWRQRVPHAVKGFPDLMVILPKRIVFFEVKAPKGRLSPAQEEVHKRLWYLGHEVYVVRDVDEALYYLQL